jgi:hypothetical protein
MKEIQRFASYSPEYWKAQGATNFERAMRFGRQQGAEINFARHVMSEVSGALRGDAGKLFGKIFSQHMDRLAAPLLQ